MPTPLIITLPVAEPELREQVEALLSPYGEIKEGPRTYTTPEVLLILDYIKDGAAIAASAASLIKTLLDLRKDHGKHVKIGRPPVPLEQLDEAGLRKELGVEANTDKPNQ
jgi:hypothetical protein